MRKTLPQEATVPLCALFLIGALIVWIVVTPRLPDKYFYDGLYIAALIDAQTPAAVHLGELLALGGGGSYDNVAWFYRALGFGVLTPPAAGFATLLLATGCLMAPVLLRPSRLTTLGGLVLLLMAVPLAVYLGQISKELPAIMTVAVVACSVISARGRPTIVGASVLVGYALVFRPYWLLVLVLWFIVYWFVRRRMHLALQFLALCATLVVLSGASSLARGEYITSERAALNAQRLGSPDAITLIVNPLMPDNVLSDTVNMVTGALRIAFPLELILHPSVLRWGAGAFQLLTTLAVLAAGLRRPRGGERGADGLVALWIAFVVVQGMFEPDFGSAVKHAMDVSPATAATVASLVPRRLHTARAPAARYWRAERSAKRLQVLRGARAVMCSGWRWRS